MAYNRCDRPPPAGPRIQLVRITTTSVRTFTILSNAVHGYFVHWNGSRTEPCTENGTDCPICTEGTYKKRWKGYLCCHDEVMGGLCFLELTPAAMNELEAVTGNGVSLRGIRITAKRSAGGPKGRMRIARVSDWTDRATLPPEVDPLETLERLWFFNRQAD